MKKPQLLFLMLLCQAWAYGQVVLDALEAPVSVPDIQGVVPNNISLNDGVHYVGSVYDTNYLPFTAPSSPATWNKLDVNTTSNGELNFQGTISTTGIYVQIPITTTGSGMLGASKFTAYVPSEKTEDGIARTLELSWPDTYFSTGPSYNRINALLKSLEGPLNIKKLDLNTGIGNDYKGVEVAKFVYKSNASGESKSFEVRAIAGIPDRCFGKSTYYCLGYGANKLEHQFIYLPIKGPDNRIWLNNNLGADYSDATRLVFNPTQHAISKDDPLAYGSLFQWQRAPDGHELMSSFTTTLSPSDSWGNPYTSDYIMCYFPNTTIAQSVNSSQGSWVRDVVNENPLTYWYPDSINDPCPIGFGVPSSEEQAFLKYVSTGIDSGPGTVQSSGLWYEYSLRLPAAGYRDALTGSNEARGYGGYYWSRSISNQKGLSFFMSFNPYSVSTYSSGYRANGYSVRCIKE